MKYYKLSYLQHILNNHENNCKIYCKYLEMYPKVNFDFMYHDSYNYYNLLYSNYVLHRSNYELSFYLKVKNIRLDYYIGLVDEQVSHFNLEEVIYITEEEVTQLTKKLSKQNRNKCITFCLYL